ncbi:hypothetical protein BSL78_25070 [Apostichopus japonicus]|uniref:Reverse transcriptase/retrotransposon-derived protein RNase H-like domain-containing protein n=1 Tax=Stichopus japonicus TaxID=307972 RepID=A0A2G8JQZ2_STIJA|nr:hypothetical protein BSL78_25070 [Apostichopus japonicus]
MSQLRQLFQKLSEAKLTVNLTKSEFCHASVTYLGHVVGQGQVKPLKAKVEAIEQYPAPTNKKALMRFLGMVGYYRKFCPNFSDIASPLNGLIEEECYILLDEMNVNVPSTRLSQSSWVHQYLPHPTFISNSNWLSMLVT